MRMRLLRSPRGFDGGEVRDVLGHDAPPLELGVNEELWIRKASKLGGLLDCNHVDVVRSEGDGDGGRVHLVDQQPHP